MPANAAQRHAVVLGGGFAGLLSARVLADHFERVTLVEKDALANGLAPRKTAPQGAHVHGLLTRGRDIFEALFPGITNELVQGGASHVGIKDVRIYVFGWRKLYDADERILSMTRPFLETSLSRRVRGLNKVSVLEGTEAIALLGDARRVSGVRVRDASEERELAADLVVDARGRISNLPDWMKQIGAEGPAYETSPLSSVYCSCLLEPKPGAQRPLLHQVVEFEDKIGVLLFPVEQNRVLLSIGANASVAMPKTYDEVLAFLQRLPVPDAYDAVKPLTPVTPLAYSRFTASVRRQYDRLSNPPEGIVALGDAVASFNPIFGQGMTVAAIEAEWLSTCLQKGDPAEQGFAKSYYAGLKPIVDIAWNAPALEAMRNNPVGLGVGTRFLLWYTERVQRAATRSAHVSRAMMQVQNMLAPPTKLFSPSVFWRVLFS